MAMDGQFLGGVIVYFDRLHIGAVVLLLPDNAIGMQSTAGVSGTHLLPGHSSILYPLRIYVKQEAYPKLNIDT
jgi:hypothetical protein